MNLTGKEIPAGRCSHAGARCAMSTGTPVAEIIELLADQLTNCVLWEPAMRNMIKDGR